MGDIPMKYFRQREQIPIAGMCMDADFKDFRKALHYIRKTKETEAGNYARKIGDVFAPDPEEEALATISVRSAFDLYFQAK